MIATSEQMRSRTYHFSEEQEKRVAALPGVKNIDGLRVTGVAYGTDDLIVIGSQHGFVVSSIRPDCSTKAMKTVRANYPVAARVS